MRSISKLWRSSTEASLSASGFQPRAGAFADQAALEFRERAEDLKHEPPAGRRGVDRLGERAEADLAPFKLLDCLDKLLERTRQAVEFPDHKHVARPEAIKCGHELGPVTLRA
jgi:hypothetical protein